MTYTADQFVKRCDHATLPTSWFPAVASLFGNQTDRANVCNIVTDLSYKNNLKSLISLYRPTLEAIKKGL